MSQTFMSLIFLVTTMKDELSVTDHESNDFYNIKNGFFYLLLSSTVNCDHIPIDIIKIRYKNTTGSNTYVQITSNDTLFSLNSNKNYYY